MATKTKAMFVTPLEFVEWIRDIHSRIAGCAVVCHRAGSPMTVWQGVGDDISTASRIYLTEREPGQYKPTVELLNEGGIGWVQFDVPLVVGDALRLSQVGARSDWWNMAREVLEENRSSLRLFDKVWRILRVNLSFPVWATNFRTGASSEYKDIGYSNGAAKWYMEGGCLRQEGVENIKYEVRRNAHDRSC